MKESSSSEIRRRHVVGVGAVGVEDDSDECSLHSTGSASVGSFSSSTSHRSKLSNQSNKTRSTKGNKSPPPSSGRRSPRRNRKKQQSKPQDAETTSSSSPSRDDYLKNNCAVGWNQMYSVLEKPLSAISIGSSTGSTSPSTLSSEELSHMLKYLFSSFAVVFRSSSLSVLTDTTQQRSRVVLRYVRLTSIPAAVAKLFWKELLKVEQDQTVSSVPQHQQQKLRLPHSTLEAFWTMIQSMPNRDEDGGNDEVMREGPESNHHEINNSSATTHNLSAQSKQQHVQQLPGWKNLWSSWSTRKNALGSSTKDISLTLPPSSDDSWFVLIKDALVATGFIEVMSNTSDHGDREEYFQIYKDMQVQYGVYLSGTALIVDAKDGDAAAMDGHKNSEAENQDLARVQWNETMATALQRLMVPILILDENQWNQVAQQTGSLHCEPDDKINSPSCSCSWIDDTATIYALQMLPSHLLRSNKVSEAARLLMNASFLRGRQLALGTTLSVQETINNLKEFWQRCQHPEVYACNHAVAGSDMENAKQIVEASIHATKKILLQHHKQRMLYPQQKRIAEEREPDKAAGANRITPSDDLVGKAFQQIALFVAGDPAESSYQSSRLALEYFQLAMQHQTASLGKDHIEVGRTLRLKGNYHMELLDYGKATECLEECIRIELLQPIGFIDTDVLVLAYSSIGMMHGMSGELQTAIGIYRKSLQVQQKYAKNGPTSHVSETWNSMGIIYGMMGEYDKAVECYSEALHIKTKKLGKDHVEVADVHFNLGLIYGKTADHESAIGSFQEALRIRKVKLGEDHDEVARVLHHIGVILSDMGELGDALRFYEEALRIRRLLVGDEHEDVARTLHNLGLVYYDTSNYERALECFEESLRVSKRKFGRKSEKVGDTLHAMGLVFQKLASFQEAVASYEKALSIRREKLGQHDIGVAATLHCMGDVYYMMGELDKSMAAYSEAFELRQEKLGEENIDVAATRNNMGVVCMKKGDHEGALECFQAALAIRTEKLGEDHEKCSDTLHNMGLVQKNLKNYDEALDRYDQALRVRKMQLGENDMKVADTLYNMAIVFANTQQYARALNNYKEALRIYRETGMTEDHPSVVNTLQWIRWAQKKVSRSVIKKESSVANSPD